MLSILGAAKINYTARVFSEREVTQTHGVSCMFTQSEVPVC